MRLQQNLLREATVADPGQAFHRFISSHLSERLFRRRRAARYGHADPGLATTARLGRPMNGDAPCSAGRFDGTYLQPCYVRWGKKISCFPVNRAKNAGDKPKLTSDISAS